MLSTSYLGTCGDFRPLFVSRQYEKQQVPTGSTSYVGTCSPTSVQCKHQSLQLSESVLTCFTTPLWSIKYLHVPLELRDFALFGGLETWSIPIRLDWRKSFSCWTAAFWTAAFKVWGKMKRCKAEGVSKFENEESMKLAELAEDSSWCPFFLHTCEDWSLNTKSEHGFTARRTFALASKWNGHCSQPYLPVSGTYSKSKPKQTASQDLTEKTAGSDRFHLICWHL